MFQNSPDTITNPEIRTHNSQLRILLWDIDGTLLRSTRNGAYKDYFAPSLINIFGSSGSLDSISVSGMTDLEIALSSLCNENITLEHIQEKRDEWILVYEREMQRVIDEGHSWIILDGVREILEATKNHARFYNALLTGNIKSAARLKLESVCLWHYFEDLPGAFGEESHFRHELPAFAAKRICEHLGIELQPAQFIVIGDTPNDIHCARHFGAKVISVATGRNNPPEILLPHNPDALLMSLENTFEVLRILESF